ncbi:telomeric repeat-binding factor 1 isoform X1 [Rattus norvegicus]|uniref:Telomeric repeat-binding factor n=1 Tax=Rattus norvegicus TaxID=10116 RepID=A0A8I5Y1U3_RAT|nr:telomeric repeat-binding factor 1 isoform X1 [Rattus norvegicus]|eukprot:XP_006237791.1 PREDICTED: telomeric repeat-binding factor 1 isoform X1 [Rattus norvegicus]
MAGTVTSAAPGARSNAGGTSADSPEKEAARDDAELFDCRVQLGPPREEENAELVAEAEAVAAGWMLDFLCLSLCRAFRDGRCEDFRQTRDSAEAIIHGLPSLTAYQLKTVYICQFLTRVAAGKSLDAQFEVDERITPLESALMIWDSIEKEHDKLHEEIQNLIKIQPLERKLLKIISQKDVFHVLFQRFSYNLMMEKIQSYVECVLNEKSSTFLMKAATKVVENEKARTVASEDKAKATNTGTETEVNSNKGESVNGQQSVETESLVDTGSSVRSHKNALSPLKSRRLQPDFNRNEARTGTLQCEIATKRNRRTSGGNRLRISKNQPDTNEKHGRRKKQTWLWEEDRSLKCGVRKYGEGNWAKILSHYKFNNRTSVMLKDRWRTMRRLRLIS